MRADKSRARATHEADTSTAEEAATLRADEDGSPTAGEQADRNTDETDVSSIDVETGDIGERDVTEETDSFATAVPSASDTDTPSADHSDWIPSVPRASKYANSLRACSITIGGDSGLPSVRLPRIPDMPDRCLPASFAESYMGKGVASCAVSDVIWRDEMSDLKYPFWMTVRLFVPDRVLILSKFYDAWYLDFGHWMAGVRRKRWTNTSRRIKRVAGEDMETIPRYVLGDWESFKGDGQIVLSLLAMLSDVSGEEAAGIADVAQEGETKLSLGGVEICFNQ